MIQSDPALPEVICTDRHRDSAYTSPFEEEREAMKTALNWPIDRHQWDCFDLYWQ